MTYHSVRDPRQAAANLQAEGVNRAAAAADTAATTTRLRQDCETALVSQLTVPAIKWNCFCYDKWTSRMARRCQPPLKMRLSMRRTTAGSRKCITRSQSIGSETTSSNSRCQ